MRKIISFPVLYQYMMTQYLFLLNKRVCNALHAVHWADEGDGGAPAHHEPQVPRVLGQLVRVVRVAEILDGVVQHNV